jgi:SPP1 family predicted phage head-tail adaptor
MRVGRLDQRVTLFSRTGDDAAGQVAIAWVEVATVWAQRITQRSAEAFAAAQMSDDNLVELHIRWRADVSTTWRLQWNGAAYDITSAEPYGGRQDRLRLLCRKGVKDGR